MFYQFSFVQQKKILSFDVNLFLSLSRSFVILLIFSCELGSRTFGKFDDLAETVNTRDDVKLAYVNCDADSEFCESNGAKGKQQASLI